MRGASINRRELLEMALRPLGALGTAAAFPQDRQGIESLIGRLGEGRPTEPRRFAYEEPGALPRYDGEWTTWLSPAGDGALRVRLEQPGRLRSDAVELRPDGRIGEFEAIEGFGVPDSRLTDEARADRYAHERRMRERTEDQPRHEEWLEEQQTRFRTDNLIRAVAAPPGRHPAGPVVAYIALYTGGVMVNYLVPRPGAEEFETDDPFADPLHQAMFPRVELDDGLGTDYKVVDIDSIDATGSPLRARLSFAPGVPDETESLRIAIETVTVVIGLEPT